MLKTIRKVGIIPSLLLWVGMLFMFVAAWLLCANGVWCSGESYTTTGSVITNGTVSYIGESNIIKNDYSDIQLDEFGTDYILIDAGSKIDVEDYKLVGSYGIPLITATKNEFLTNNLDVNKVLSSIGKPFAYIGKINNGLGDIHVNMLSHKKDVINAVGHFYGKSYGEKLRGYDQAFPTDDAVTFMFQSSLNHYTDYRMLDVLGDASIKFDLYQKEGTTASVPEFKNMINFSEDENVETLQTNLASFEQEIPRRMATWRFWLALLVILGGICFVGYIIEEVS